MSFGYVNTLPTDKDWVRFKLGDTVDSGHLLEDEEIAAILAEEDNKYLAAASALEAILARMAALGLHGGQVEKRISRLNIKWGTDQTAMQAARAYIEDLRRRGRFLQIPSPRPFRVLR